jgi:hypothetical protein
MSTTIIPFPADTILSHVDVDGATNAFAVDSISGSVLKWKGASWTAVCLFIHLLLFSVSHFFFII